jgi:dethiobiotin synthetase
MAKYKFFITGTDTDVGKTLVATGLLVAANQRGLTTVAIKPVAAGCEETGDGLRNRDALLLQQAMSLPLPYAQVNPVALQPAIAPHIAAQQAGKRLGLSQLVGFCRGVMMQPADLALIEGAGGWRVPLNSRETLAGLASELELPVIMVVGMKLGCINHALLTAEAIAQDGLKLAGWVANQIERDMPCYQDNLQSLKSLIRAPCVGELPFLEQPNADAASRYLKMDLVITH